MVRLPLSAKDIQFAETDIAIVGMAAHLPGADTVAAYWDNLKNGIESIRHYSKEELLAAGEAAHRLNRPDYVPAAAPLSGYQDFDAEFFGLSFTNTTDVFELINAGGIA